ncbi:MAG: hypothetical protein ACOYLH_03195 [Flavobacteriales bacterium]
MKASQWGGILLNRFQKYSDLAVSNSVDNVVVAETKIANKAITGAKQSTKSLSSDAAASGVNGRTTGAVRKAGADNSEGINISVDQIAENSVELVNAANGTVLSAQEIIRIKNAATRIGKPITVVGSRAIPGRVNNGVNTLTGNMSDWDYIIEGLNSKDWSKIKNSLPGAQSSLENVQRNIDIHRGPINFELPHITFCPPF